MIIAIGKRIVVKEVILKKKETKSLVILPNEREQVTALVIAVGGEVDSQLKPMDVVILPESTGLQIEIDGENYLSINDNQILAAFREE